MRITTLGPLAVDGRPVRGERLAAVVRELVEARGRTVSVAALVDAVWDGAPPDDAPGAVQALVSRVRRLGLAVDAVPGGYRVPAEQLDVDAVRARVLVERGRTALRAGDVALARRCGDEARELFPAVPDGSRLLADVAALRAEAALAGDGGFDETDLRLLVALTPPDEPSAALLVRVLAAQGRDAEALDVLARLRGDLATRYGADPSPLVSQVHVALLRGELSGPTTVPRRGKPLPAAWRRAATPLVGREHDVAAVAAALGRAPLVTVVATGGAGKTRLAAEVARGAASSGRAVYVVELAGLRSPDAVLPALLAAVGAADPAAGLPDPRDLHDRLRAAAQDLAGLVVLDNCEHLLAGAAAAVADLVDLAASPELEVLATSRAPLSLPGEVVHRLRALPDGAAVGLLESRTRAGGAALAWHPDLALELCHRLDNLPLALELAAARLRHMPIQDVLAGLTDRFALLDDALRGLPERHASLWAMVDWSRELLAAQDRDLLQRLAVIPAPFTTRAAAAVAGGPDVRRGLATLVEQSLLSLEQGDDGAPRYRMLETVREYGEVRLDTAGERDAAMAGLVRWAAAEAAAVTPDFIGPGQLVAFARCVAEQDNLVAALGWAIAHGDEPAAVDVAAALFHLWTVRGLHSEVVAWSRPLLHADDPAGRRRSAILHGARTGRPLPDADRITWLAMLVGINSFIGDAPRLLALTFRALRTLTAERHDEASARALALASTLPALAGGDTGVALAAATRLTGHPDPYVAAFGYSMRATVLENNGVLDESLADAERAYRGFEAVGDHWGMGMTAHNIGSRGTGGADEWLRRGERHMALLGAQQDAGSIRVLLDIQLALAGDPEAAGRLGTAAATADLLEGDVAQARIGLAQVARQQERHGDALAHAEAAMALMDDANLGLQQVRVVFRVAAAVVHLGVAEDCPVVDAGVRAEARATALLTRARDEALASPDMPVLGSWALGGAALAAYQGSFANARELWTLGTRLGARVVQVFQGHYGARLTAALGDEDSREPLVAAWRERSVVEATGWVRELMDGLLRPSGGTPPARAA